MIMVKLINIGDRKIIVSIGLFKFRRHLDNDIKDFFNQTYVERKYIGNIPNLYLNEEYFFPGEIKTDSLIADGEYVFELTKSRDANGKLIMYAIPIVDFNRIR